MKNFKSIQGQVRTKYNIERLKSQRHREAFLEKVRSNITEPLMATENVQDNWKNIKTSITDACVSKLGNKAKKNEDFISPQTWNLIDERASFKNKINSMNNMTKRKEAQNQYRLLDKQVKRSVRDDKTKQIRDMTLEAENAAVAHNMKECLLLQRK